MQRHDNEWCAAACRGMTDTGGRGTKKSYGGERSFPGVLFEVRQEIVSGSERLQEIQEGKVGDITEDVVQESFLLAFVKWDEIRKSGKPMGWLVVTAKYYIYNQIRRKDNQTISYQEKDMIKNIGVTDSNLDFIDDSQLLRETLTEPEEREMFTYYLCGYKSAEIAEKLNMNENTVRVKIKRMKDKIRGNWNESKQ